ncbi:MAG: AAA family ATPase [Gammaproteobacteria bacterium]
MVFFSSGLQLDATNLIKESISNYTRLIVVTGEAGTGKTLLVHRVIDALAADILPIFFHASPASVDDFVGYIFERLHARYLESGDQPSCKGNIRVLRDHLRQWQRHGQSCVVVIDDAQNLSVALLECMLWLETPEQEGDPFVQLILIGLPGLVGVLQKAHLQSPLPESQVYIEVPPLSLSEAAAFLASQSEHRPPFSPRATTRILFQARGIPRLINMLCECASFGLQANEVETVTEEMVDEAIETCEFALQSQSVGNRFDALEGQSRNDAGILSSSILFLDTPSKNGLLDPSKRKERPMYRTDNINKVLKTLQSGSPDVEAAALISEDGLMIASVLPQDLDETRVAGMSATLLSLGTRAAVELGRGDVQEVVVRGRQGYSVMVNVGRGALLLVVANENAKLGLIFFDMREAANALRQIL